MEASSQLSVTTKWSPNLIGRPVTAASIAFLSAAIGGVIAVWPREISEATQRFVHGPRHNGVAWWIVLFWAVVIAWGVVLYLRLAADDRKETARIAELTSAIYRAPNYDAILSYRETFGEIALQLSHIPSHEKKDEIAERIVAALVIVAGLAAKFRGAPPSVRYGANIMLVIKPDASHARCFPAEVMEVLRFYDLQSADPCTLGGVLYLPPALLYHGSEAPEHAMVPVIALPVPHFASDSSGHVLALPGAPWALLEGGASVYRDARHMKDSCADLAASIRDEVAEYFGPAGDGRMIRSLVSFRMGNEVDPVGVLNLDCSETDLLGSAPDYYPTFYALMAPILRLLADAVNRYAVLATH